MNTYVFKRYELKYLLTAEQYAAFLQKAEEHIKADEYGETTIQSLYYDTSNFLLIRRSMEKPKYKEKLRLRSYGLANKDKKVFLELKKKYDGIVYKRRITLKEGEADDFLNGGVCPNGGQIGKEIAYFRDFYGDLKARMLILYDRTAYAEAGSDLRITFDKNIRYRTERLTLHEGLDGIRLHPDGRVLKEIKTGMPYPLWLVRLLDENKIYKISFSKYGEAYKNYLHTAMEERKVG
jgi:hypothetical protein